MNRRLPSLPPLRDMVDMSQSRGTPPSQNASWTAINHRAEGPVSPSTHHANPQVDAQPSPPSHHQAQIERPILQQTPAAATSSSPDSNYAAIACSGHPRRFTPGEQQIVEKPITARQDSAVFPSATHQIPTTVPPGNTSSRAGTSPELHHRPAFRDAAVHPLTPPSDPSSLQSYPSSVSTNPAIYDRPRNQSSTGTRQETAEMNNEHRREPFHSDVSRSTALPLPQTALIYDGRSSMPPPPVPIVAPSLPREAATADSTSPPSSTASSQQNSRYPSDASNAAEEGSADKCAFCHETWTYPPPDTSTLVQGRPSLTLQDMQQNMDALSTFTSNYRIKKEADYQRWKQLHSGGHCNCTDHHSGSKRKLEGSVEATSPPLKYQKRASASPPRTSHLTPPPDPASDEAASGPQYFEARLGPRIPLDPNVARVIGRYIPPADDSNNMFYDAHGERKTVKTEETAH